MKRYLSTLGAMFGAVVIGALFVIVCIFVLDLIASLLAGSPALLAATFVATMLAFIATFR